MKRILSVVAALAIVGSALAFKVKGETASIVCILTIVIVDPSSPCPITVILIPFVADPNGSIVNPCAAGYTPYDISNPAICPVAIKVRPMRL